MNKIKPILVILATIGTILMNWLASTGFIGGITPEVISNRYPTFITPAGYAFTIWGWIFLGMIIFAIIQAIPKNFEKFSKMRTFYLISCVFNCLWIYVWHNLLITVSVFVILSLLGSLAAINLVLERENNLFARMLFGGYFAWVTVASVVNITIALVFNGVQTSDNAGIWLASGLIVVATIIGIFLRHKLPNFAYAFVVAWGVTAIAVKQSGKTPIVVFAAFSVIALLISAFSFIMKDYKKAQ